MLLAILIVGWGLVTLPLLWRLRGSFLTYELSLLFIFSPRWCLLVFISFLFPPIVFLWWVFMSFVDSLSTQYHCVNVVLQVFIRFPPPTLLRCVVNFFAIQAGSTHVCLLVSSRSVFSLLMSNSPLHSLFLVLSINTYRYGIRLRCEKHSYMTSCVVNTPDTV